MPDLVYPSQILCLTLCNLAKPWVNQANLRKSTQRSTAQQIMEQLNLVRSLIAHVTLEIIRCHLRNRACQTLQENLRCEQSYRADSMVIGIITHVILDHVKLLPEDEGMEVQPYKRHGLSPARGLRT